MMTPTPDQIAKAEALFERAEPTGLTATQHPFHRWSDKTQQHFIELAILNKGEE